MVSGLAASARDDSGRADSDRAGSGRAGSGRAGSCFDSSARLDEAWDQLPPARNGSGREAPGSSALEDAGRELGRNTSDPDESDRDDSGRAGWDRPAPGCSELGRGLLADSARLASSRASDREPSDREPSDREASDREVSVRDASELADSGRSGWDRPAPGCSELGRELPADSARLASSRAPDREPSDREVSDREA
ncbi:MAG TPA: hypothetical protein VFI65_08925 [Streptosporangiaceae bacterium]|nr:hypothetical protein [Streptosporangiaceae bacterium]